METKDSEPVCPQNSCRGKLVPMRFVSACENGHLDDVDWLEPDRPFLPELRAHLLDGERLPGGNVGGITGAIGYSPYCVPRVVDGVKCVMVNEALRDIEIMAWDFVMNFARDNQLRVEEITEAP